MKKIDELKAEIKKAEKELNEKLDNLSRKRDELEVLERIKNLKDGDYVECQINGERKIALLKHIEFVPNGQWSSIEVSTFGRGDFDIFNLIKWQPKRGDLCIFWDYAPEVSVIEVFLRDIEGASEDKYESSSDYYVNCIPFISEQQFKEHIGYEEC